jgi:hypothetical protein
VDVDTKATGLLGKLFSGGPLVSRARIYEKKS